MPDDLSILVGELRGGFKALLDRVDRSDEQTTEKIRYLAEQHDAGAAAAIKAREEKEAREDAKHEINQRAIETVRTEFQTVALQSNNNAAWIKTIGGGLVEAVGKMETRVTAIEDHKRLSAAEERGSLKTWGFIGAIATAIGTVLAGLITYGRDAIDFIRSIGNG